MGTVVSVIASMLLLVFALDHPFHRGIGGLRPEAMQRTLRVIDEELAAGDVHVVIPCDAEGIAT